MPQNAPMSGGFYSFVFVFYLYRQKSGQVDLCNGFGHRLVLYAPSFGFDLIQLVLRPHQMENFIVVQQSVSYCGKTKKPRLYFRSVSLPMCISDE